MSEFGVRCLTQSVAPSCLNRDGTGLPKDCPSCGVCRTGVSGQSLKRALRERLGIHRSLETTKED